jgi:hypothetical protein
MAQVVQYLPGKAKALSLKLTAAKKKKKKLGRERENSSSLRETQSLRSFLSVQNVLQNIPRKISHLELAMGFCSLPPGLPLNSLTGPACQADSWGFINPGLFTARFKDQGEEMIGKRDGQWIAQGVHTALLPHKISRFLQRLLLGCLLSGVPLHSSSSHWAWVGCLPSQGE